MLEQEIRRVEFETEVGKLTPRFGPLMNDSHLKHHYKVIEKEVDEECRKYLENENKEKISNSEMAERVIRGTIGDSIMNREFPSLQDMNQGGWKLESFAHVLDDNKRSIQVAIFSRES